MKKTNRIAWALILFLAGCILGHDRARADSIVQIAAEVQGLEQLAPAACPQFGTYWWAEPNATFTPAPCPPLDPTLPVYAITSDQLLIDGTGGVLPRAATVAAAMEVESNAVVNLINQVQGRQIARTLARAMGISDLSFDSQSTNDTDGAYSSGVSALVIDTNQLWLQITNLIADTVYASLNQATDQVYAIWSTTNLALPFADWQVELEVFPTNSTTNCLPFTISMEDRPNLFLRAQDWTGVDSDGDGIPDWWIYYWFGNLNETATDLDSQGNTLLADYQNYTNGTTIDPNVISFTLSTTNLYVNSTTLPVFINLTAGTPSYVAVLVNDTNTADAVWQPYSGTNLTATLGLTNGLYNVWVGLKGWLANATVTWDTADINPTLDRSAPTVTIVSPSAITAAGVKVVKPYLQLKGIADKPLASLAYDLSNATEVVAGVDGYITDAASYDTNYCQFMTNYFQCYDIPLATNDNFITLRVTDIAGNTTVTNFDVILDYSGATNPPVLKLFWPHDGMAVGATAITIRGNMSDETGTIQAQIVDASGNTNLMAGLVERNGLFWIQNVPLDGTNQIIVQATDAAGNVATTNFTVLPSSLILTVSSTPTGEDLYQPSGTVTGTVSDPNAVVAVNGTNAVVDTSAVNSDGTYNWTAVQVPVYGMGTATFDVTAEAKSSTASANISQMVEMPAIVKVTHYSFTETESDDVEWPDSISLVWTRSYDAQFAPDASGQWRQTYQATETKTLTLNGDNTSSSSQSWSDPSPFSPNGFVAKDVATDNGISSFNVDHNFAKNIHQHWDYPVDPDEGLVLFADVSVSADTRWTLYPGGISGINKKSLHVFSGSAYGYGISPDGPYIFDSFWFQAPITTMAAAAMDIMGESLDSDYQMAKLLPDNTPIDLAMTVPSQNHFGAGASDSKYTLGHLVWACALPMDRTTVGIGETVSLYGMPDGTKWSVSGGGTVSPTNGSSTTFSAGFSPKTPTVHAEYKGQKCTQDFSVIAPSSITVISNWDNPSGTVNTNGTTMRAETFYEVLVSPTNVDFNGAHFRENVTPNIIHWPCGIVETNMPIIGFPGVPCSHLLQDDIKAVADASKIFNGTNYANFSFSSTWTDQYQDDSGNWVDIQTLTVKREYNSSRQARVTYLDVPGGWQGPF